MMTVRQADNYIYSTYRSSSLVPFSPTKFITRSSAMCVLFVAPFNKQDYQQVSHLADMEATHQHDLIGELCCLLLLLLEIRGVTIEFSSICLLVEPSFNSKQLLVGGELIPLIIACGGTQSKCNVISVTSCAARSRRCRAVRNIVCPCLQRSFSNKTGLADVNICLECCKRKMSMELSFHLKTYYRRWSA